MLTYNDFTKLHYNQSPIFNNKFITIRGLYTGDNAIRYISFHTEDSTVEHDYRFSEIMKDLNFTDIKQLELWEFKYIANNENYRYGDQNKSPNSTYLIRGYIKEYVKNSAGEISTVILSGGELFQSNIKDIKLVDAPKQECCTRLFKTITTSLFGPKIDHCDQCGSRHMSKIVKKCVNCHSYNEELINT